MDGEKDVTLVIKTFIRMSCVERLLCSIEKYARLCPIIICDDSPEAEKNKENILSKFSKLNIEYIITEEDIGLSKGRNILVENVKTKYFVLCDDDFIFYKQTNISLARRILEENRLDILGGLCLHANRVNFGSKAEKLELLLRKIQSIFHNYRKVGYKGIININDDEIEIQNDKLNYHSTDVIATDICENFFIAKTQVVKELKWYDVLKLNEHEDFFIRAKKEKIKIGVTAIFKVYHYPEHNVTFKKYRNKNYYEDVLKHNNINKLRIIRNNVGVIQTYLLQDGKLEPLQDYTNNWLGKLKKIYYKIRK